MLYPMFMKLDKKIISIVGGGKIAADKLKGFEKTGALIFLISPEISENTKLLLDQMRGVWIAQNFNPKLIAGSFLVIAATSNIEVNEQVFETAKSMNILVNNVDVNHQCDWFAGSAVKRNDFQIALSSNGKAPAYLSYLRSVLEDSIPENEDSFINAISEIRNKLKLLQIPPEKRKDWFWSRFAELEAEILINKG